MQPNITITQSAVTYITKMLAKNAGGGLRLSIKKTGCSGYSYLPEIVSEGRSGDTVIDVQGVSIILDTTWLHLLDGVQIDYIEEEKSGLKQKRLLFTNKKEAGRCGCGESFHIE